MCNWLMCTFIRLCRSRFNVFHFGGIHVHFCVWLFAGLELLGGLVVIVITAGSTSRMTVAPHPTVSSNHNRVGPIDTITCVAWWGWCSRRERPCPPSVCPTHLSADVLLEQSKCHLRTSDSQQNEVVIRWFYQELFQYFPPLQTLVPPPPAVYTAFLSAENICTLTKDRPARLDELNSKHSESSWCCLAAACFRPQTSAICLTCSLLCLHILTL